MDDAEDASRGGWCCHRVEYSRVCNLIIWNHDPPTFTVLDTANKYVVIGDCQATTFMVIDYGTVI